MTALHRQRRRPAHLIAPSPGGNGGPTTAQPDQRRIVWPRSALVSSRWYRPVTFGLTTSLLIAAVAVAQVTLGAVERAGGVGLDYRLWVVLAQRWIDTGSMYAPYQLAGPYIAQPEGWTSMDGLPSLYPPPAVFLFLPTLWLPALAWWLVPLAGLVMFVARCRPSPWTWPLLAAVVVLPSTWIMVWVGNTTIWLALLVAGGLRFGWPGVLVLVKPSLAPFALVGVWHRSWWVGLAAFAVLGALMAPAWLDYVTAIRNAGVSPLYSLESLPLVLVPVIAWVGRLRPARVAVTPLA